MSTIAAARARRAAEAVLVHTACPHAGRTVMDRYSDAVHCGDCGAELVPATPGRFRLDYDFACGLIDTDEYAERLDALMGHP